MDKEQIKRIVANPRLIPGIYNYCDRWCERCAFTSRCANYAIGEEDSLAPEERDVRNERFWTHLREVFRVTLEMLGDLARQHGVDLDALDTEEEAEAEQQIFEATHQHPCVRSAARYAEMVEAWFDSSKPLWAAKGEELALEARLELPGARPEEEAAALGDAVEVIRWYEPQIQVKLARAVSGALEENRLGLETFAKDSGGSAKVALLGMDRSIAAWGTLLGQFPQREREVLELLVRLAQLRRKTEAVFPDARAFVRPGFDEDPADGRVPEGPTTEDTAGTEEGGN